MSGLGAVSREQRPGVLPRPLAAEMGSRPDPNIPEPAIPPAGFSNTPAGFYQIPPAGFREPRVILPPTISTSKSACPLICGPINLKVPDGISQGNQDQMDTVGDGIATSSGAARRGRADTAWRSRAAGSRGAPLSLGEARVAPDSRRRLQLVLAGIWLLDAVLQYQSVMFSRAFPQMLAAAAQGNPAFVAGPVAWSARLADQHLVAMNALFAAIQLMLGLGIAWRPTVRVALAASVAWALAVWWLGEGLGLVLTGRASPLNGAPGPVILYALLAVLLWPGARDRPAPFVAGRGVGTRAARALWLILWGSLAFFALTPASRAPQAASGMISSMAAGEPGWLTWLELHAASALAGRGLAVSAVLAAALVVAAVGAYLPARAARLTLVLVLVLAAALWLAGGLGGVLTGSATDPGTGPLLALLAVAYWPARDTARAREAAGPTGGV